MVKEPKILRRGFTAEVPGAWGDTTEVTVEYSVVDGAKKLVSITVCRGAHELRLYTTDVVAVLNTVKLLREEGIEL